MREVPFAIIKAAQDCDSEAVAYILKHFEGYIASRSIVSFEDEEGQTRKYVDEDLRYAGEIGLYSAIFKFRFKEPIADFPPP